ncbi:MAG: hypothetical protein BGO57_13265 [Sphingomonadales bacterium 63-6]|nr:MAG: hypothetical protein BGO57_13265 [Sphingomonadales bacterium 63-6]
MAIEAGPAGIRGRRVVSWIDVRPQIVAGDAVESFGLENVFGRQALGRLQPLPHRGLGDTERASKGAL